MKGLALPVIVVTISAAMAGAGYLAGLGSATALTAICGLFCMIAAFGGPLRADLRLLACFAPAIVLCAGVPRLLAERSEPAAIAMVALVVFVAGLLPVLGQRYVTVGLGLGMASVFAYGFRMTGSASAWQVLAAPAVAVLVAILFRLLAGLRDPEKATRTAIADALTGDATAADTAVRHWLADRPLRWTATALAATMRYRLTRDVLTERADSLEDSRLREVLESAREEAEELAERVRERHRAEPGTAPERVRPEGLPGDTERWLGTLYESLDELRAAASERDRGKLERAGQLRSAALRRSVLSSELEGVFSWSSVRMRHAIRCALGMALAMVIAQFRPGDPLTISLLMTTFAIMQPEWRDSLSKITQRLLGSLAGAVVLVLASWLLPPSLLLPLGILAVLAGVSVMTTAPIVFNACIVLMSVSVNAAKVRLDPLAELGEYLVFMAIACAIGLLFGFLAVPGVRTPSAAERFGEASARLGELLGATAERLRGGGPDWHGMLRCSRRAARARQNLLAVESSGGTSSEATEESGDSAGERLAEALYGVHTGAVAVSLPGGEDRELAAALDALAAALPPGELPDSEVLRGRAEGLDSERRLVFDAMLTDLVRLHHGNPEVVGGSR